MHQKSHSSTKRSDRFHGTCLCSQGSVSLNFTWAKPHPASNTREADVCQLNATCSSTQLWLQESINLGVSRNVFCPSGAPAGCGEQSCVPGDLLRQPPPGARQPLRAAGHSDEPTGQDQVSASCFHYHQQHLWFLKQKEEKKKKPTTLGLSFLYFLFLKTKVPPTICRYDSLIMWCFST